MNRRSFVFRTLGTLGFMSLPLEARQLTPAATPDLKIRIQAPEAPLTPLSMPGLFPGRVVQTFHSASLVDGQVSTPAIRGMLDAGMKNLTGETSVNAAWARFFEKSDVVALKANPSGTPTTITSVPLIREVISSLNAVGVPYGNIIVYDRYTKQMEAAGYFNLLQPGVRVVALDQPWVVEGTKHPGHDPDVFCEMTCFDEKETRSCLGTVVLKEATKIINLPCLKEHNGAGVTGCLKNLAYGSFDNVGRTHQPPKTFTDPVIAVMAASAPLRSRTVLHIMEGIRAVYHGGPIVRNPDFIWEAKTLLLGTDPVAIDRVELEIIEQKRRSVGAPSLWDRSPENLGSTEEMHRTAMKNRYLARGTGHIRTAAGMGLGRYELDQIKHTQVNVG
jgi:uncharacterized protein (DUF362 family)